jgi:drug/metabolite transporter (DMT)-like permease
VGAIARDVIFLGAVWGASVVLQRLALAELTPLPLVVLRLLAGLAFFIPFLPRVVRGLPRDRRTLLDVGLVGALNPGASALLSALALQVGLSGLLAILACLAPLAGALLARLYRVEAPVRAAQLVGMLGALGGVAILVAGRSTGLGSEHAGDPRAYLYGLLVALSLAASAVHSRRLPVGQDAVAVAACQIAAGLLLIVPAQMLVGAGIPIAALGARTWLAVGLSGALGLGASFVYLLIVIRRHGPTASLLLLYVVPLTAAGLGVLLLGETVDGPMALGAALILGGLLLFSSG